MQETKEAPGFHEAFNKGGGGGTILERLVALMPLEDGRDIKRFTKILDALDPRREAVGRDEDDRGVLWHAVNHGDHIACQILLERRGFSLEVLARTERGTGSSPYELALAGGKRHVLAILKKHVAPELEEVVDAPPMMSSSNSFTDFDELWAREDAAAAAPTNGGGCCCCCDDAAD